MKRNIHKPRLTRADLKATLRECCISFFLSLAVWAPMAWLAGWF